MKHFQIYTIANTVNRKKYVGKTINGVERRWREHKQDARRGSDCLFHRGIRKHCEDAFFVAGTIEIGPGFAQNRTQEELSETLNSLEIGLIARLGTTTTGYNAAPGGACGGRGLSGFVRASKWLNRYLQCTSGVRLAVDVRRNGKRRGFSWRTLNRVKAQLGIKSFRRNGKWYWAAQHEKCI